MSRTNRKLGQENLLADDVIVFPEGGCVHIHAILEDGTEVCMPFKSARARELADTIRRTADEIAQDERFRCTH